MIPDNQTTITSPITNATLVTSGVNVTIQSTSPTVSDNKTFITTIAPVTNASTDTPLTNATVPTASPTITENQTIITSPITNTTLVTSGVNVTIQSTSPTVSGNKTSSTTITLVTNASTDTPLTNATVTTASPTITDNQTIITSPITNTTLVTSGVNVTIQSTSPTVSDNKTFITTIAPFTNANTDTPLTNATVPTASPTIPDNQTTITSPITNITLVTSGVNVTIQSTSPTVSDNKTSITTIAPVTNASTDTPLTNATVPTTSPMIPDNQTTITSLITNATLVTSGVNVTIQSTSPTVSDNKTFITTITPVTKASTDTPLTNTTVPTTSPTITDNQTIITSPISNTTLVTSGVNVTIQSTSPTVSDNKTSITAIAPVTNASTDTPLTNATVPTTSPMIPDNQTTITSPITNATLVTSGVNVTIHGTSPTVSDNKTSMTTTTPVTNASTGTPLTNATVPTTSPTITYNQTIITSPITNTALVTSGVNVTTPSSNETATSSNDSTVQTMTTNSVSSTNTSGVTAGTNITISIPSPTEPGNQTNITTPDLATYTSTVTPGTISTTSPNVSNNYTSITTPVPVTTISTVTPFTSPVPAISTAISSTTTTTSLTTTPTISASTSLTSATPSSTIGSVTPAISLFPYGTREGDITYNVRSIDFTSPVFQPKTGFPFGNSLRNFIYYTDNGQIVFPKSRNSIFSYAHPPVNGFTKSCNVPSIAVYWSDADLSSGVGSTYYQEYNSGKAGIVPDVEKIISNNLKISYKAQWTLKITWEKIPVYPAKQSNNQTNTFQAVLTTDGFQSYVLILFEDGGMNWEDIARHPSPLIGYCSGNQDQFFWNDAIAVNKNRPNLYIGNNSDVRGLWIYPLNNAAVTNSRMNCLRWFNAQPNPLNWNSGLLSCPCLYQQGQVDSRFRATQAGSSSYISLFRSTSPNWFNAGVRCVYYRKNQFLEGFQERTWNFNSSSNDEELQAYDWCCNDVDDPQFCSMYLEKRPSIDCRKYSPPRPAWMFGDPHITTLDWVGYTFNGRGDFTLLNASAPGISIVLQGRTVQTGTAMATNFQAFAMQYISTNASVTVEWYLVDSNNTIVLLNGQNVSFTSVEMEAYINDINPAVFLKNDGSMITATFEGSVSVGVSTQLGMLTAITNLPNNFLNNTKGLLGTWNNDQSDDFSFDNGTTIPINSSEEQIFYYGMDWEVKGSSLFSKPREHEQSTFIPLFFSDLETQFPQKYEEYQKLCENNTECIYDALSTNNTELAVATRNVSEQLGETNSTLNAVPPYITGNSTITTFMESSVTVQYTANGTGVVFSAETNATSDIKLHDNGTFTWTPTKREGFTFNLLATDSQNLSSTFSPSFIVCSCNLSIECDYSKTSKVNGSSLSITSCNCANNSTGDFCEIPPNLCAQGCFPGVLCDNKTGCGACPTGFTGDGVHCSDTDECVNSPCSPNAVCENTPGAYNCTCKEGFMGNGTHCEDIDECKDNHPCSPNATCTNIVGSYTCTCKDGFPGNGTHCDDIDECENNPCSPNATCTNTEGSYTCTCKDGFTGNGTHCEDIDECKNNPCSPNANCTNTEGSYICTCKDGFTGNGLDCEAIIPCQNDTDCATEATCSNTTGSYICTCNNGYKGNGTHCDDFDECKTSNPCSPNAICTNTVGSYTCTCKEGFKGNGTYCEDIDECETRHPCSPNATCTNTEGSYTCTCKDGLTGNGTHCEDIDECKTSNSCSSNATCSNTEGSYTCTCKDGFTGNGTHCEDIDECETSNPCSPNATCTNTEGSYTCTCKDGFTDNGTYCEDIDECKTSNSCSPNANCSNTEGSYTCTCKDGFTGNGTHCEDIDECTNNSCSPNATCTNTEGSYTCTCKDGFTGNGTYCSCAAQCEANYCSNGGTCTRIGSNCTPQCICLPAFSGEQCKDMAESFMADLSPSAPKRSVNVSLTSISNFSSEGGYGVIKRQLDSALYDVAELFRKNESEMEAPRKMSTNFSAIFTARFKYVANVTIIRYLNDDLIKLLKSTGRSKRSTDTIIISDVTDVDKSTVEQLAEFATCPYDGYTVFRENLQCVSKCDIGTHCQNYGICHLDNGNVSCSCKPFSIYITSGPQCEHLSMNLNAFFGILFGSLAFLLLLLLGIWFGVWWYRKIKQNDGDIDEAYHSRFSWKTSLFSSFERLGEPEVPTKDEDSKNSPDLVNWKPHLEKVNSLVEVKIKRPEIKQDSFNTGIRYE